LIYTSSLHCIYYISENAILFSKRYLLLITTFLLLCCGSAIGQKVSNTAAFKHNSVGKALRAAKHGKKFIFAFVYTEWSIPSKRMMDSTFNDAKIIKELSADYETLEVNAARKKRFVEDYNIHIFPTYLVMDWTGQVLIRSKDYKTPDELLLTIAKTRSNSRFLRENLDSLAHSSTQQTILNNIDSIAYYKGGYEAKNLAKKYLDRSDVDWRDPQSMVLIKDYFTLHKKYLRFISKYHFKFFERFDSLTIKENIAFHVFLNSLDTDKRGRAQFNYKPVRKWFRKHRISGADKLENFVKIKYLLWGRGPSVSYSIKLLKNYPETTDENVLFASVIRLLISKSRRSIDYDELIHSLRSSIKEDGSYWRYDLLSLLHYKNGEDNKSNEYINLAKEIAQINGDEYEPTLNFIKDIIER